MALAREVIITKDDISTATATLGFLSTVHGFKSTDIGKKLDTALTVLEVARIVEVGMRDPKRAMSEAVESTLIAAMNTVPALYALNVAGDISAAILPTLQDAERRLATEGGHDELLAEYKESMGIVILCAAYNKGVSWLINSGMESLDKAMAGGSDFFIPIALRKGQEQMKIRGDVKQIDGLMPRMPKLAMECGEVLQKDGKIKSLNAEIAGVAVPYMLMPKGVTHVVSPSAKSKPLEIDAAITLLGGAGSMGAAVKISTGIALGSFLSLGLAAVALTVASFLVDKHYKRKAKEFRKSVRDVGNEIQSHVGAIERIYTSSKSNAEKIKELSAIMETLKDNPGTREMGTYTKAMCEHLDRTYGGHHARPVVDAYREMLRNICNEVNGKMIPTLKGVAVVFGPGGAAGGAGAASGVEKLYE